MNQQSVPHPNSVMMNAAANIPRSDQWERDNVRQNELNYYAMHASSSSETRIQHQNPPNGIRSMVAPNAVSVDSPHVKSASILQINGHRLVTSDGARHEVETGDVELYIRRVPSKCNEAELLKIFERFGKVKHIRLPLDPSQENRGFGYAVYTNLADAVCAMDVLKYYFINQTQCLELVLSHNKKRLFVSNIPSEMSHEDILAGLRIIYPKLVGVFFDQYESQAAELQQNRQLEIPQQFSPNRGCAFIHFGTHDDAVEAKKNSTPGIVRLWNRDIKVSWAVYDQKPEDCPNINANNCGLFIPNFDPNMQVNEIYDFVKARVKGPIKNIFKSRNVTFLDFETHEAAENALKILHGTRLESNQFLVVKWSKSKGRQNTDEERMPFDYDAGLRTRCIANYWDVPIILYGTYFPTQKQQYVAIIFRSLENVVRAFFLIMSTNCPDLHDRVCEVGCTVIDYFRSFPDYNYIFEVKDNEASLLGIISHNTFGLHLLSAFGAPPEIVFDYTELVDLSWATARLASESMEEILNRYQKSFQVDGMLTFFDDGHINNIRRIATIPPKFRNKPALPHGLNDTQMVLALNFLESGNNWEVPFRPYNPYPITAFFNAYTVLPYLKVNLNRLKKVEPCQQFICVGDPSLCHPAVRGLKPPMNIFVCSYATAIRFRDVEKNAQVQNSPQNFRETREAAASSCQYSMPRQHHRQQQQMQHHYQQQQQQQTEQQQEREQQKYQQQKEKHQHQQQKEKQPTQKQQQQQQSVFFRNPMPPVGIPMQPYQQPPGYFIPYQSAPQLPAYGYPQGTPLYPSVPVHNACERQGQRY